MVMRGLVHVLLAALGMMSLPDTAGLGAFALALAAVCIVALVSGIAPDIRDSAALASARRERAPSALVSQSDPDARGHARPRAPGHAAAAA